MNEHLSSKHNNIFPSLQRKYISLHKKSKINEFPIRDFRQQKHLKNILSYINPQSKIMKAKEKATTVLHLATNTFTNCKYEALSNKNYYNTSLTHYNNHTHQMSYTYNSFSSQINSEKKCHQSRNKILSLDLLNSNNLSKSITSNSNRKPVIILNRGIQHNRASLSIIDQKQTEAETSLDKKIPLSNMSSLSSNNMQNKIDMTLEGFPYKASNIKLKKLSNIPENSNLSKRNINKFSTEPSRMTNLKIFLRTKSSFIHQRDDKTNYLPINDLLESNHISKRISDGDGYSSLSDTIILTERVATIEMINNMLSNCPQSNICLRKNTMMLSKEIEGLSKFISSDDLNIIDEKRNKHKQKFIKMRCDDIEQKIELLANQSTSSRKNNDSLTVIIKDLKEYLQRLNPNQINTNNYQLNEFCFLMEKKSYYNVDLLTIILYNSLSKILLEKYEGNLYFEFLHECLDINPIYRKQIILKRLVFKKLEKSGNKQYLNKHLERDFSYFNLVNKDIMPQSSIRTKNRKSAYNTVIHKLNPFSKKILKFNNSVSLNTRISKNYYQKMSLKEKRIHLQKNEKTYSLLKNDFYSRDGFDVRKLKEKTEKMELIPRCKAKNIKFKIVDEQEEIKKNKNMSKESLIFRTQEIKLKIKDKLETIEEILFFLIKELNFKEFKKLLEQYQVHLESRDNDGNTYLIFAVECYFMECVVYLIQKGADINAQNFKQNTPLHIALMYQNFEIADLLLKHGAAENILNKNHMIPWQCLKVE